MNSWRHDSATTTTTRGHNCSLSVATLTIRGHGRSLYVAAPTTFLRRDECDRPGKQRPSGSDPRSGQGDGSPTVFSNEGDASPAAASNPGPSCYACSQNFRQSGTPKIAMHDPTNKHNAVACPDLNSPYRDIAQPMVDPGLQLPLRRPTPATAATNRSGQAPGLSHVMLRAA